MLDIATTNGIRIETLGLPILGGGAQRISSKFVATPMINECLSFLRRNECIRRICVITNNPSQAYSFAKTLDNSYTASISMESPTTSTRSNTLKKVFLSYASEDKEVADILCAKLESHGIRVWYAPRDVASSDYATSIVRAIEDCTHFVVILSRSGLSSQHVLNEIDLAFQRVGRGATFAPIKIDETEIVGAFKYYLSRQHWMNACKPPLEERLEEFTRKL